MWADRRCPKCGGYKFDTKRVNIAAGTLSNRGSTGQVLNDVETVGSIAGNTILASCAGIFLGGIVGVVLSVLGYVMFKVDLGTPSGVALLVGPMFIGMLVANAQDAKAHSRPKNSVVGTKYSCRICGYEFGHPDGAQWPPIEVRPDLIVKGNKLNEDEEAAAAAYGYWLQQQQQRPRK